MMKDWKDVTLLFLTLACLVLLLFYVPKCGPVKIDLKPKLDTVTIHHRDTIFAKDTLFVFKHIKVPVPQLVIDTFLKSVYVDTNDCRRVFVYQDSLIDSNLVIYYKDYIQGILRDKEMSYKLKVPLRIYDSTTIKIKVHPKFALYGTLSMSKGMIAPMGEVALKRLKIGVGYNLLANTPAFSVSYKLLEK